MTNTKFNILIIDDEKIIIDAVVKIAGTEGYTVDTSQSAVEAIEKIKRTSYDLIITDIMMPEIDGFQLIDKLEKLRTKTPVVVTTGYSTVDFAVKALQKGAIAYLPKPFTSEELISIIKRGIEYKKIAEEIEKEQFAENSPHIIYVPCPPKYYRLGHNTWINIGDEGLVVVGVTDLYLKTINSVEKLKLMTPEENLIQGNTCAYIFTNDGCVHQLLAPLSGLIIDTNKQLATEAELLEKDPYFGGWIYKIIPSDLDNELKNLISCSTDRI